MNLLEFIEAGFNRAFDQLAQQPTDTTDVEQDLDTLIANVKTIGK